MNYIDKEGEQIMARSDFNEVDMGNINLDEVISYALSQFRGGFLLIFMIINEITMAGKMVQLPWKSAIKY